MAEYEIVECPEYEWGVFASPSEKNTASRLGMFVSTPSSSTGEFRKIQGCGYKCAAFQTKKEADTHALYLINANKYWTYEARKFPK